MKIALWILAIIAVLGPCMYMSSGNTKVMSGAAKAGLKMQMRQQVLAMEMQMGEAIMMNAQSQDPDFVKKLVAQLNSINEQSMSPQALAEIKKEGINPGVIPKPILWVMAPEKQKRSLSLAPGIDGLLVLGWGMDLEAPIFETKVPGAMMR